MNIIDAYKEYCERYPENTLEDFANAVASAAANDDPEVIQETREIDAWEKFTRGTRYAQDERRLDYWKKDLHRKWRAVYDRTRAEVLAQFSSTAGGKAE